MIVACHHEQNIFKMGGLWKKLPLAYASFIVGGAAAASGIAVIGALGNLVSKAMADTVGHRR